MLRIFARSVLPYLPGRVIGSILRDRPYLWHQIPPGRSFVWPRHDGDISVWVDNANAIEHTMLTERYDAEVSAAIARFVAPGDSCIDIGANCGAVSLMLAKAVGPTGRVIAVEPGPPYVVRLRDNLTLNPDLARRIHLEQVGIGEAPGTLTWEADPDHPWNALIADVRPWGTSGRGVRVPVETLDALVARLDLPRVDFVKIDVESMELEVFRGAQETLRSKRPYVLFESMDWARNLRLNASGIDIFAEIRALLESVRYRVLTCGGLEADWGKLPLNTVAVPLNGRRHS